MAEIQRYTGGGRDAIFMRPSEGYSQRPSNVVKAITCSKLHGASDGHKPGTMARSNGKQGNRGRQRQKDPLGSLGGCGETSPHAHGVEEELADGTHGGVKN